MRPVTPNPSPQAVDLLDFITSISGRHILTGQHNVPLAASSRLDAVHKAIGLHPALFGQDFGFAAPGDWDGIDFRPRTIGEIISRARQGFVITLMWHAVRPIEDEPVTFCDSICGKLTDTEWSDLIRDGSPINQRWKSQVDVIASHLKQLKSANVPVLWRPYHEMNGGWFWWGKRPGADGAQKLYRMLFDRLVNFHDLDNLIWVYNCNEQFGDVDPYAAHYPGDDVADILATDVYRGGFAQKDYEDLLALAGRKPIALGEVGVPPGVQILENQPRWAWFMVWDDPAKWLLDPGQIKQIYTSPRALTLENSLWANKKATDG